MLNEIVIVQLCFAAGTVQHCLTAEECDASKAS